jgi:hypothetical protein
MEAPRDTLGIAREARQKGLVAIPCRPGTKVPAVTWKRWQHEMPPWEVQRRWFEDTRVNIAIVTTGLVIFDCDDAALADLVLEHCGDTPHKIRTPSGGIHLGYRRRKGVTLGNRVRVKGMPIDIRTDGGLEVIPNSMTADGCYSWLGEGLKSIPDLPVASVGWTRERTRRRLVTVVPCDDADLRVRRARAYIAKIVSVQGQRGSDACFRAACKLRDFGLSPEEALALLAEWNLTNAFPPWTEKELLHKRDDAFRRGRA